MMKHLMIGAMALTLTTGPVLANGGFGQPDTTRDDPYGDWGVESGGGTPTGAGLAGEELAAYVCATLNEYQPVDVVSIAPDGMGDYIVWMTDTDGDVWACNASGQGDVYAYDLIIGDLLEGLGREMLIDVGIIQVGSRPTMSDEEIAVRTCWAVSEDDNSAPIVAVEDGVGDYLVWIQETNGDLYMCNANGNGEIFIYTKVDYPIASTDDPRDV